MSLIKCKKCGKEYSVIKDNCPFCGHPQQDLPATPAEQTPQKKKKELYMLPPDERKSPIAAAAFSFLFWWIALDTFYLKGLFKGFCTLLFMYIVGPIVWCVLFLIVLPESVKLDSTLPQYYFSTFTRIGVALLFYLYLLGVIGIISSIIKAIYYVALPVGQFNRQYTSYTA